MGKVFPDYPLLCDKESEETEFNILAIYLIWQKKLGKESFYYPYLQCIELAETIISWDDTDISRIKDPYITVDLVNELRSQFPEAMAEFQKLARDHP